MTQHRITDKSKDKMTECTRTREQATITRDRMIDILNPLFMHRKSFDHWLNISVGTLEWVHYMSRYAHQYEEDTDSLLDIV